MEMGTNLGFESHVHANMERGREIGTSFKPKGKFRLEHWRDDVLIGIHEFKNGVTDVGINNLLDIEFFTTAKISTWYLGVIDNSGFTALAAADTMASHAGWTEFQTYNEANRVTWVTGAASSKSITNATPASFNITGTATLNGIFAVSENTKGGTTGILWATGSFVTPIPVVNGDILKITYTVTGA